MWHDSQYLCASCGEEIVVPIDVTAGARQEYTEDCPVCCHPNLIRVELGADGEPTASAESEQDLH